MTITNVETRIRPAADKTSLRLIFDDGTGQHVDDVALIGRNRARYDGEMNSRLITVHDTSMSVSKTHLHVRAGTPALGEIGSRVHLGQRSFTVRRA